MYGTARQAYIDILTELLQEEAPTFYLEDFLYIYNKAISEYMKGRYELFETTQQLTDDLRAWKKDFNTTLLDTPIDSIFNTNLSGDKVDLYRHLTGCRYTVIISRPISASDLRPNIPKTFKVGKMTADLKTAIIDNDYLQPTFYRPYFDILNNKITILTGDINTKSIKISNIVIEYLSQPKYVDLTEDQIEADEDTSQVLEFPKDVGEEITKIAVKLILERGSSNRLQSNVAVNATISDVSTGLRK